MALKTTDPLEVHERMLKEKALCREMKQELVTGMQSENGLMLFEFMRQGSELHSLGRDAHRSEHDRPRGMRLSHCMCAPRSISWNLRSSKRDWRITSPMGRRSPTVVIIVA